MKEKEVAYHEAGHAVIALTLKYARKPKKITIIPNIDKGSLGRVVTTKYSDGMDFVDKSFSPRQILQIQHDVISHYAGPIAEKKYTGKNNNIGARKDHYEVISLLGLVVDYGNSREFESLRKYLYICAESRVSNNWHFIKIISDLLYEKKTLYKDDVLEAMYPGHKELKKRFSMLSI